MRADPFELTAQGREALRRLDRDAAAAAFEQALEEQPAFVDAIVGLGQVAYERDELREAAALFDRAVRLAKRQLGGDWPARLSFSDLHHRSYLRAIHGVGLVQFRQGDETSARQTFTLEQQLDPDDHQGSRFLLAKLERGQDWAGRK